MGAPFNDVMRMGKRSKRSMGDDMMRLGRSTPYENVMRMGKRAPFEMRLGKRAPYEDVMRMGKRAPFNDVMRMGKRTSDDQGENEFVLYRRTQYDDYRMVKKSMGNMMRMGKRLDNIMRI